MRDSQSNTAGTMPPQSIALTVQDYDPVMGTLQINKARVGRRDKDRTKTGVDRIVELCPRAMQLLNRHLVLRAESPGNLPPADDRGGKWRSKWLSEVEEEWRRGWDSNPRAGITRPSDFESAPL